MDGEASNSRIPLDIPRGYRSPRIRPRPPHDTDYLDLIPHTAAPFEGRIGTLPFQYWIIQTRAWMTAIAMPDSVRTTAAVMCLQGAALEYWDSLPIYYGEHMWSYFQEVMALRFSHSDAQSIWLQDARFFAQHVGELISEYSTRFHQEIVAPCPHIMSDWEMRDFYIRGLQPASVPPEPVLHTLTYVEVRLVVEQYDYQRHAAYLPGAPVFPFPVPAGDPFQAFAHEILGEPMEPVAVEPEPVAEEPVMPVQEPQQEVPPVIDVLAMFPPPQMPPAIHPGMDLGQAFDAVVGQIFEGGDGDEDDDWMDSSDEEDPDEVPEETDQADPGEVENVVVDLTEDDLDEHDQTGAEIEAVDPAA